MSVCFQCGQSITLWARLRGETRFCCREHRELFEQETRRLAIEALERTGQALTSTRTPEPPEAGWVPQRVLPADLVPPPREASLSFTLFQPPQPGVTGSGSVLFGPRVPAAMGTPPQSPAPAEAPPQGIVIEPAWMPFTGAAPEIGLVVSVTDRPREGLAGRLPMPVAVLESLELHPEPVWMPLGPGGPLLGPRSLPLAGPRMPQAALYPVKGIAGLPAGPAGVAGQTGWISFHAPARVIPAAYATTEVFHARMPEASARAIGDHTLAARQHLPIRIEPAWAAFEPCPVIPRAVGLIGNPSVSKPKPVANEPVTAAYVYAGMHVGAARETGKPRIVEAPPALTLAAGAAGPVRMRHGVTQTQEQPWDAIPLMPLSRLKTTAAARVPAAGHSSRTSSPLPGKEASLAVEGSIAGSTPPRLPAGRRSNLRPCAFVRLAPAAGFPPLTMAPAAPTRCDDAQLSIPSAQVNVLNASLALAGNSRWPRAGFHTILAKAPDGDLPVTRLAGVMDIAAPCVLTPSAKLSNGSARIPGPVLAGLLRAATVPSNAAPPRRETVHRPLGPSVRLPQSSPLLRPPWSGGPTQRHPVPEPALLPAPPANPRFRRWLTIGNQIAGALADFTVEADGIAGALRCPASAAPMAGGLPVARPQIVPWKAPAAQMRLRRIARPVEGLFIPQLRIGPLRPKFNVGAAPAEHSRNSVVSISELRTVAALRR